MSDGKDVRRLAQVAMILAAVVFFAASSLGLRRVEPFFSWYFCFAWWPYILFVEGMLHLTGGESDLFGRPRLFLARLPLSALLWMVFEAWNFRLGNWHYVNMPPELGWRWLGYALSFATVLPGLYSTAALLRLAGVPKVEVRPRERRPEWQGIVFGAACLILSLVWPQYFFALVWIGFIPLLAPLNRRLGQDSPWSDHRYGDNRSLALLLAAGAICGLLWEFWNWRAGAKWYYTVPLVGDLKLFEMPILGFIGFPPFAVAIREMESAVLGPWERSGRRSRPCSWLIRGLLILAAVCFFIVVCDGMDRLTVASFRGAPVLADF